MSSFRDPLPAGRALLVAAALLLSAGATLAQAVLPGLGRAATPKEIAAWDIDVRPDFKGLPKGAGSVEQGQVVWEDKCASCHGVFGESNQVFTPLVGGTTADDVKTGRVARLLDTGYPGRTTMMKVATVSTLWDYINRAMPWTAPKTLKTDEVYAVTAFLLNLADVVPADFVLSDQTMAQVQARLPNRKGMTTDHALWPGKGLATAKAPDVKAVACMQNCGVEPKVASLLPDFARNAHGNLAEQNRLVGAQHGADTTQPAGAAPAAQAAPAVTGPQAAPVPAAAPAAAPKPAAAGNAAALALLNKYSCVACHGMDSKLVGPSFKDIAAKQGARPDAIAYLVGKIRSGGSGVWGQVPMPPQVIKEQDAGIVAQWLADGARK